MATIRRFGRALDDRDWAAVRGCLDAELDTDYSSFRGTPPARLTADAFVDLRRTGLAGLVTRHLTENHRVRVAGDRAICRCDFVIRRWPVDGTDPRFLHSYGSYAYRLRRAPGGWRVVGITQVVDRSEGDPQLHGALRGRTMEPKHLAVDGGDIMATAKQKAAARRNVKKAAKAARRKRTITRLPKKTRSALGKEGAKAARRKRSSG